MPDPSLHQAFYALIEALNPEQRSAVEQIEGPVLVVAGPGTGKTHVLAARIGKILLETDARPQNILCLTFTDAGVHAMRQRLLGMIGPEAHRVPIFTFHAFCNRIIQENLEYFGRTDLEPVTDLERIEIVRRLLEPLPPAHALKTGKKDGYFYEKQLRNLFSLMKKENWTPGYIHQTIRHFLQALPQNPDYFYQKNSKYGQKGAPKTAKIQDVQEKMERLAAAADLYPKYLHAMQRAGRYEYEDMILWVLRAFEKHEALLRNYQERYQYFLVDEYQDTNGAQNRLLQQLLDYWPDPNVFIVGDDDQSIYEFQGARLQNLLDFYRQYEDSLHTVVLQENYRSPQTILDAAQHLIEHNQIRAVRALHDRGLQKQLRARHAGSVAPRLYRYPNRLQEISGTVSDIEALLAAGTPPQDIAVLYAKHKQAQRLIALLEKKGIPYETKRPVNILDLPAVRQFRELLHYLRDELRQPFSGEHRLLRLLHAPWWQIPALDLAIVAAQHQLEPGTAPTLRQRIAAPDHPPALRRASELLESWLAATPILALPALIERLYAQSGWMAWALQQPDKAWWLQVLSALHDFVRNETDRHPRTSLDRLTELLDSMDDNRLALEIQQQVRSGAGVQLLTAHASKGLEFDAVFVLDTTDDFWEPGGRSGGNQFALPDTLTLSGEEDALEARRRLFYVAITRAKRQLVLSYAAEENGKALRQARFTDELALPVEDRHLPEAQLLETQSVLLQEAGQPFVSLPDSSLLDRLLEGFTLSITALNRFLRCPLSFYYQDVLRLPESESEAATYGHAMHYALQQYFLKMKTARSEDGMGEERLLRLFNDFMEKYKGRFSSDGYQQRLSVGQQHLRRYYVEQVQHWKKRAVVERRIERVEWNGIPMTGVLDKIEWLDNGQLRIIDYKTGTPDPKKTAPPSENQPLGGEYWRQLVFYALLLRQSGQFAEPVRSGVIAWLDPGRNGSFVHTEQVFTPEDMQWMEEKVQDTYTRIQARDFNRGCGQEDCAWCRLHQVQRINALPEMDAEGLDD
jgi:DNA helicase II / ATP-dependent DNA helicase PcrA